MPCLGRGVSKFLFMFAFYLTNRICEYAYEKIGPTSLSNDVENNHLSLIIRDFPQTENDLS